MNLSAPFIKRPVMTTLVMVAILLFGLISYHLLPVSDLPTIDYPTITVYAYQPGGSPEYMANTIATPLERNFASISGLNTMTSTSKVGETNIILNFDINTDLNSKEVEVQAAITETLPIYLRCLATPHLKKQIRHKHLFYSFASPPRHKPWLSCMSMPIT